jgi:hypothetical protein
MLGKTNVAGMQYDFGGAVRVVLDEACVKVFNEIWQEHTALSLAFRKKGSPGLYNLCVCINESQKDALFIFHVDLHTAWAFLNIAMKFTTLAILKSFDLSNIWSHEILSFIKVTEQDGGNILPDCTCVVLGRHFHRYCTTISSIRWQSLSRGNKAWFVKAKRPSM